MAGFNTAVTGLKSASQMLDVAGNNIANSSTVGFKSSRTEFADIYATSVVGAGASNQPGSGITVSDISQDFSAGTIEFTNNNLDLAINGSGFFQLDDGQGGITYTRAGTFELDKDGYIVSKNGKNLQGYGLDALGNVLPLQDLAVTQKESAPKATEMIDLSFNIDSSADATTLSQNFDKTDPGSYTYSTTVEMVDSLGNSNSVRFYVVEQRPVREAYSYNVSDLTPPSIASSATIEDISALAIDFQGNATPAQINTNLTDLQFDFATNPTTFDVSFVNTSGATVGPATVTLNTDWAGDATAVPPVVATAEADIASALEAAINAALNVEAGTTGLTYATMSVGGVLELPIANGSSITVDGLAQSSGTGGVTAVSDFLGGSTVTADQNNDTSTASFDFVATDINGNEIFAVTVPFSSNWTGADNGTLADGLALAINDAINTAEGTSDIDYVSVSDAGEITLVGDELVNSMASFTVNNFAGANLATLRDATIDAATASRLQSATNGDPESIVVSGITLSFEELMTLPNSVIQDPTLASSFSTIDPRIDTETLSYDPKTGVLSFELFSYATQVGDVVVSGRGFDNGNGGFENATELSLLGGGTTERDANEVQTFFLDGAFFESPQVGLPAVTTQSVNVTIGGVDILLNTGLTQDDVGDILESYERTLIEKNPDIESVVYDRNLGTLAVTWKASAGDVDPLGVFSDTVTAPFVADPDNITSVYRETEKGDNSFQAQYRLYGFLNDTEQLDLGKIVDPGESGFENDLTEVGSVLIGFDPTTGILANVNGNRVSSGGTAPAMTLLGADPANPNDEIQDSDTDGLAGIQLNITGTTQFASESIVKSASQDGYPKGDLIGVTFAETGEMVASFSNGQRQNLGLVAIASFENQAGLASAGSTEWIATLNSGAAILNPPGTGLNGTLRSAALESSNVDLSAELVKLIEAQRNFQANSKTLETQNTVTQAILQI